MTTRLETLTHQLDAMQDRLGLALSAGDIGVWDWDIKSDSLYWDAKMFTLFGVDPLHFGGTYRDFAACLNPDDARAVAVAVSRSINERKPYEYAFRLTTVPGRIIRGKGRVYFDAEGEAVRMVGVCLTASHRDKCESCILKHGAAA